MGRIGRPGTAAIGEGTAGDVLQSFCPAGVAPEVPSPGRLGGFRTEGSVRVASVVEETEGEGSGFRHAESPGSLSLVGPGRTQQDSRRSAKRFRKPR
jgi:hypothetical protein